jgi:hypothetical protein
LLKEPLITVPNLCIAGFEMRGKKMSRLSMLLSAILKPLKIVL